MRFERKNLDIKHYSMSTRQFKSLTYTISRRYCSSNAYYFSNENNCRPQSSSDRDDVGMRKFDRKLLKNNDIDILNLISVDDKEIFYETTKITENSILIRKNQFYLIDKTPIYAHIKYIFIRTIDDKKSFYIIANLFKGIWESKLFAYKLVATRSTISPNELITIDTIIDHNVYTSFRMNGHFYIPKFIRFD